MGCTVLDGTLDWARQVRGVDLVEQHGVVAPDELAGVIGQGRQAKEGVYPAGV